MAQSSVLDCDDTSIGRRLLPHVLSDVARNEPEKTWAFAFEDNDVSKGFRTITVGDIDRAVNYTASWLDQKYGTSKDFETLAYIGISDIRYQIVHLASIKCGYKLLCISVRNSDAGYLSLLEDTSCEKFLCSKELVAKGLHIQGLVPQLQLEILPSFNEMCSQPTENFPYDRAYEEAENDPALICHTSGSTGKPKPITLTNGNWSVVDSLRLIPEIPGRKNQDWSIFSFERRDCFISTFPSFHATGMIMGMLPLIYQSIIVIPPPDRPATGDCCLEMIRNLQREGHFPRAMLVAPTVVEQMVQEPGGLDEASKLDFVMFTGGPLAPSIGDRLSQVTDICQLIGSTETGPVPNLVPERKNWSYFEWQPYYKVEMDPQGDGTFELTLRQDPSLRWIRTVSHTKPDMPLWRSSDLYRPHPENGDLWRFEGRLDDVVVLSNGEKFNPVSMESTIQGDPLLKGALYSGLGKFQPALLVEPKEEVDPGSASAFIERIWPSVEKANTLAPQHAQIYKHKVAVSNSSKAFRRAAKGTVIRKLTLQDYAEELDALYSQASTDEVATTQLRSAESLTAVTEYVRECVCTVLDQTTIPDDQDLFTFGLDSLQTLELVRKLKAGLDRNSSKQAIELLTIKQVYANPCISALSLALHSMANPTNGEAHGSSEPTVSREALMESLLSRYTKGLTTKRRLEDRDEPPAKYQKRRTSTRQSKYRDRGDVNGSAGADCPNSKPLSVVVTGTTGSIGTYLLVALLKDPKVASVYCLNRSDDALQRQNKAFEAVGAAQFVGSKKLLFIRTELHYEQLGLGRERWNELVDQTDAVIHNAWKVDFNHQLRSFEDQIAGTRRLVDLCERSHKRAHLMFVSSVSSVGNWSAVHPSRESVPESPSEQYAEAQLQGYGESKHVAERVLQSAARTCKLPVSVLRLGQIAGPTESPGIWNTREWLPSLVRTSKEIGLIPNQLPDVDWIPVDAVADILVDILHASPSDSLQVMNIVNPQQSLWTSLIPTIREWYGPESIQPVPLSDWIAAVRLVDLNDQDRVQAAPAAKILEFFEAIEAAGHFSPTYDTYNGIARSQTMAKLRPVSPEWMRTWLQQWNF